VIIWDTKRGEQVKLLAGDKSQVTALAVEPVQGLIACGHSDGQIRVFDYETETCRITFSGHKLGVSCLSFDDQGMRLVSGACDTEIVVWDVVSESGLFRLKGHKNLITKCSFIRSHPNILVSSSKDTLVKFWDLETQHCFKTITGHRSEVWDFILLNDSNRLITGAGDSELRVWEINFDKFLAKDGDKGMDEPKSGHDDDDEDEDEDKEGDDFEDESLLSVEKIGSILRKSTTRVLGLHLDSSEQYIVCHGTDALVECFKIRTENEVKEIVQKRAKKREEKIETITSRD
jgi:U3 small nucleolar RNA-associated protein 12